MADKRRLGPAWPGPGARLTGGLRGAPWLALAPEESRLGSNLLMYVVYKSTAVVQTCSRGVLSTNHAQHTVQQHTRSERLGGVGPGSKEAISTDSRALAIIYSAVRPGKVV